MINTLQPSKGLAITYLVRLSIGSPSGGRSEIENLNVIKKIREGFFDFPYASSQAMKRALRDTLKGLGHPVSPIITTSPAKTAAHPTKYIDDDLFGYMDPSSKKESKISEESELTEENGQETAKDEEENRILSKDMLDKVKAKKHKEKIEKFFNENPSLMHLTLNDLKEKIGFNDRDMESLKKAIFKDDSASLNKMLQNMNGVRKSIISMSPLLSLSAFDDTVDFGANMMGLKGGISPMPYETEVHRGWYRITLYIDLDRIGTGDGFINNLQPLGEEKSNISEAISQTKKDGTPYDFDFIHKIGDKFVLIKKEYSSLENKIKYRRSKALLDCIRFLAPSGRSSNWLIDLTPKLMVAAYVKGARTPFLETPLLDDSQSDTNLINIKAINTAKETFDDGIEVDNNNKSCLVIGYRNDLLKMPDLSNNEANPTTIKIAFETIDAWLKKHFNIQSENSKP